MTFKDITSHEKACEIIGKDHKLSTSVHDQLDDIASAINKVDSFQADYNNSSQQKWFPIFDASRGFRFDFSGYDCDVSDSDVGSRLCQRFRSEEIADFFGKQFESLHIKAFYGSPVDFKSITSHEIACSVLGKDSSTSTTTDKKLTDICNAINKLNGNFKADFNNPSQKKWRPYFIMDSLGFRFGLSVYVDDGSHSHVGSRLCHYVGSEAEADHLGKQFIDLHKTHYMGE